MNIVIVGAGELGRYIATILSKEEHNVILVDTDHKNIERAIQDLDVAVRHGSGTDWQLIDELYELFPDMLIALTSDDETNLVSCTIAKQLGYPKTIARIRNHNYLNRTRLDFGRLFDVDSFVGPELLAAHNILKYMLSPNSLLVESFAHGAVQLRTLAVPPRWHKAGREISTIELPEGVMIGLIEREINEKRGGIALGKRQVLFPHGGDRILPNDEVTFIGETTVIADIHQFFGITSPTVRNAILIGGSLTALNLAKSLAAHAIDVTIVEKDHSRCAFLAEQLPNSVIINQDGTDINFLKAEKTDRFDIFVACTNSDEVNLMSAMLARENGSENAVVMLSNPGYATLAGQLGVNHTVSPRVSAANHILSQILSGTVRSLISLYNDQAEIMEVNVSMRSSIVGIPLSELGPLLPDDFLIAMIQNRGRIMIANGNRIISGGDSVIVITHPRHTTELQRIF